MWFVWKENKGSVDSYKYSDLLKIAFIGYFLVYILIEVQTRYRYEQYLLLAMLSAPMIEYVMTIAKQKYLNKQLKK